MKRYHYSIQVLLIFCVSVISFLTTCRISGEEKAAKQRPKKVFAHYMGCWPVGCGPIWFERYALAKRVDVTKASKGFGGHVRNFDLIHPKEHLKLEESVDLEIRRALRFGIDGFAIDAWAGGDDAKKTCDAFLKVAKEKNYPFEITICYDPMCGGGTGAVIEFLKKYKDHPKLARRDGKPLIFGYGSLFFCFKSASKYFAAKPEFKGKNAFVSKEARLTPEGWNAMGKAFEEVEKAVGEDIYWHFDIGKMWMQLKLPKGSWTKEVNKECAKVLSKYVDAFGSFTYAGPDQDGLAKTVIESGCEWSQPVGMYQKENIPYERYIPNGTDNIHGKWKKAMENNATLLQLTTWNDYGENTNISPAWNTRYTLADLTRHYIQWWKTGVEPKYDDDRIYLIHRKYPKGAKVFPFNGGPDPGGSTEVITMLTKPGTIKLQDFEPYEAPAGFHRKKFPIKPGIVAVELSRDGNVVKTVESPERITEYPFREDHGFVCMSTEFEKNWKADFGDKPIWHYSEYGDEDNDGLPNWYEMLWFGKFGDFKTQTIAEGNGDPDNDGKTNIEEMKERTNPHIPPNSVLFKRSDPMADNVEEETMRELMN